MFTIERVESPCFSLRMFAVLLATDGEDMPLAEFFEMTSGVKY